MKSIKAFLILAFAASFASGSLAAAEPPTQLIKVPKNEAAMEATRATIARDAANPPVKPAAHKTKTKSGKAASTNKVPPKPGKAASSKPHQAKPAKTAPANKHPGKAHAGKK